MGPLIGWEKMTFLGYWEGWGVKSTTGTQPQNHCGEGEHIIQMMEKNHILETTKLLQDIIQGTVTHTHN